MSEPTTTVRLPVHLAAGFAAILAPPGTTNMEPVLVKARRLVHYAEAQLNLAGGPVVVGSGGGYGCDGGEFPAVALFTTRAAAEAAIQDYDDAVRRAEADGVHGICHVGDYKIANDIDDVVTDPGSLRELVGEHLYLLDYWPEAGT